MSWFGFMSVFVGCSAYLTMQGLDTSFWTFKTQPELELQQKLIEKAGRK